MDERDFVLSSNFKFKLEKKQNGMDCKSSPYVLFVTWSCSLQIKKLIKVFCHTNVTFLVHHITVIVNSVVLLKWIYIPWYSEFYA